MDHWALVGQKLTAEKHLADDAKKVRSISVETKKKGSWGVEGEGDA